MPVDSSPRTSATLPIRLLHLWRVALLCLALAHEREHPALAVLLLVPLNHLFFRLTTNLDRPDGARRGRAAWVVVGLYLLATLALVRSYGSLAALLSDLSTLSRSWEWWALIVTLSVLTFLYRPIAAVLRQFIDATGLQDPRLWKGLEVAVGVWIWCDALFAALFQQLSLLCDHTPAAICGAERAFSQPLTRFPDALYFSTVTLSTAGYGDIAPVSDLARMMVSLEIVVSFGLLGFLLSRVAGATLPAARRPPDSSAAEPPPPPTPSPPDR
ncbi:MAG TPA: potassium channel family protein [Gemmatimonadales bacterium]|nr:potassium channel family protein [Gemmatimonadales bacterium]